ncbi:MAG: hypothetical protein IT181_13175 [Acidobacteria bacterium]|nr:hypothetical protein [Acidobacteriota bacterium]
MPIRLEPRMVAKTAAYSPSPLTDRAGTIFTTRGATGAVAFTLPTLAAGQYVGLFYDFLNLVDQNMSIVAPTADTLLVFNDTAADSVAYSTSSQKIGALARAIWDGTAWIVVNLSTANALTVTT